MDDERKLNPDFLTPYKQPKAKALEGNPPICNI